MISTNWENSDPIKRKLVNVNFSKKLNKSGLPVLYDNNKLYNLVKFLNKIKN